MARPSNLHQIPHFNANPLSYPSHLRRATADSRHKRKVVGAANLLGVIQCDVHFLRFRRQNNIGMAWTPPSDRVKVLGLHLESPKVLVARMFCRCKNLACQLCLANAVADMSLLAQLFGRETTPASMSWLLKSPPIIRDKAPDSRNTRSTLTDS